MPALFGLIGAADVLRYLMEKEVTAEKIESIN
jgi:hypothetical protein